jgi:hypothetical protein
MIGYLQSSLCSPNDRSGASPLIEATRKVNAPAWCVSNFFPKKFGTHHVRATRQ